MKRAWKISELAGAEILSVHFHGRSSKPSRSLSPSFLFTLVKSPNHALIRDLNIDSHSPPPPPPSSLDAPARYPNVLRLITEKPNEMLDEKELAELAGLLGRNLHDSVAVVRVLEEKRDLLLRRYYNGSAIVKLLKLLDSIPQLALQVFNWRRKQEDCKFPMTDVEYAIGINLAGKVKNTGFAIEMFSEAASKRVKTTSTYNALMSACMVSGYADKCQLLFRDLKKEPNCSPTIVTYNILISVFGQLLLIDHMETTFREMMDSNLSPNLKTYNTLIAGYLTAWMWDDMERTFQLMQEGPVKPETSTYVLLLRGYAYSGNLEKMEQVYELTKDYITQEYIPLVRTMICAYCKSSNKERAKKIKTLMRHIPEEDYRPWFNVLLIRVYAEEDSLEAMEESINEAFNHKTAVNSLHVMKSITATYFHCKAVDRLATFIKRAESAGWRKCRSLYHCKMILYAYEKRLEEMESVLDEMENINLDRTKKTFWILYNAYLFWGQRHKAKQIIGLMYKHGYEIPMDVLSS